MKYIRLTLVCTIRCVTQGNNLQTKIKSKLYFSGLFLHRIFLAFSAKTNFPHLNKAESSNESLAILYGIRTFSIFMIILDHKFGTFVGGAVSNFDYIEQVGLQFESFVFKLKNMNVLFSELQEYTRVLYFPRRLICRYLFRHKWIVGGI